MSYIPERHLCSQPGRGRLLLKLSMVLVLIMPTAVKVTGLCNGLTAGSFEKASEQKELYISFPVADAQGITDLGRLVSLDMISGDSAYAYISPHAFAGFASYGIPFSVLRHPGDIDFDPAMRSWDDIRNKDLTGNWDFYPEYEAYVELMYSFQEEFPELVKIYNIGQTVYGRDILFAQISESPGERRDVPKFMYTATIHGDETAGFILSLRLIHHIISNYGKDEGITELVRNTDIWICPNENPDGTYRNDNSTVAGATRSNLNGVDLNRNYPNPVNDPWDELQPETEVMISFTDTMNFIMSANMHGGTELVNFPFDSWRSDQKRHADHKWWEFVMREYVDTVHKYSPSGYMTGQGGGLTHGGDWYVVYGSRQDYFNYYRSCREFTLELSNQKLIASELLPDIWEYNYRSLINYIRQSGYGLHGKVYDNASGDPIEAVISIPGHDELGSEIVSSVPFGNYNRPLLAGDYNIVYSAEGYEDLFVEGVRIEDYQRLDVVIALGPQVSGELHSIVMDVEGEGYVDPFQGQRLYNSGANLSLEAVAEENWEFDRWVINGDEFFEPDMEVSVDADLEILAIFSEPLSVYDPGTTVTKSQLRVYPNPLEQNSVVSFEISEPGVFHVAIYDVWGKEAATIHKGFLQAGVHTMGLWGFYNHIGPGVYVVRLSGAGRESVQRIFHPGR